MERRRPAGLTAAQTAAEPAALHRVSSCSTLG